MALRLYRLCIVRHQSHQRIPFLFHPILFFEYCLMLRMHLV